MAILNIQTTPPAGQTAVTSQVQFTQSTLPSIIYIYTNDTYAAVTATGYLNSAKQEGYTFSNNQMALVYTTDDGPVWLKVAITYSGASVLNTVVSLAQLSSPGDVILPTTANAIAVFSDTAGTLTDNIAANNAVSTSSATPGTIRAIKGAMTGSATTMTSGNLVGVRGEVDCVGASGGFLYGVQGKIIPTGTLSGSSWSAGLFGQFDISAATVNAGQTACIWGDYGTSSGTITNASGMRGIAMTNTTAAVLNAQDYRYGNATYLLELAGAGGTLNYYAAAGTSAGSAGDAAHCAAQKVIAIEINGVAAYIPVFTQNT
jgi:hypothetical protein